MNSHVSKRDKRGAFLLLKGEVSFAIWMLFPSITKKRGKCRGKRLDREVIFKFQKKIQGKKIVIKGRKKNYKLF